MQCGHTMLLMTSKGLQVQRKSTYHGGQLTAQRLNDPESMFAAFYTLILRAIYSFHSYITG